MGQELRAGWRKLHSEELRNFYSSSDSIKVIKRRRSEVGEAYRRRGRDQKYNSRKPEGKE
jgi:hypothetical protein